MKLRICAFTLSILYAISVLGEVAPDYKAGCSENSVRLYNQSYNAYDTATLGREGDIGKAIEFAKAAVKDSSKCKVALTYLSFLYTENENYVEANKYADEALKYYPEEINVKETKAIALLGAKKHEEALKILFSIKNEETGFANYLISATYSEKGDLDKGIKFLCKAMAQSNGWGNESNAQNNSSFDNLKKDNRFWAIVNGSANVQECQ